MGSGGFIAARHCPHAVRDGSVLLMSSSFLQQAEAEKVEPLWISPVPQALRIFAPHLCQPCVEQIGECGPRLWLAELRLVEASVRSPDQASSSTGVAF